MTAVPVPPFMKPFAVICTTGFVRAAGALCHNPCNGFCTVFMQYSNVISRMNQTFSLKDNCAEAYLNDGQNGNGSPLPQSV